MHQYFFLPVEDKASHNDQLQLLKDLFDKSVPFEDLRENPNFYKLKINNSAVAIMESTSFGSDPRTFMRIRVGSNQKMMINVLTVAAQAMNGFTKK